MKKKLNIIVLLSLIVLTLFTFGCKKDSELGADPSKWNNQESIPGEQKVLEIEAKDYDIDWWVLTKSNKVVYEDYTVTIDGVEVDPSAKIETGKKAILKFNNISGNQKFNLYIAQEDRTPKKATDKLVDYTGWVYVSDSQGYRVKDSGYRDEVSQIGVVVVICDETGSVSKGVKKTINGTECTGGSWNGNYEITEVWPLSNKEGPQWEATEGLKYYLKDEDVIEEGESIKLMFPAGDSVIALKQPSRFNTNDQQNASYEKQKEWYWCAALYESFISNGATEDDDADTTSGVNFATIGSVTAHKEKDVHSSKCYAYFKLSNNNEGTMYKSALGTTYIIDEADIVDGSSEK